VWLPRIPDLCQAMVEMAERWRHVHAGSELTVAWEPFSCFGYSLVGDMNAQVAACRTGERRLQATLDRFGHDSYVAARDVIFRQSGQLEMKAPYAQGLGRSCSSFHGRRILR
jgi:hypothetical protein